MDRIYWHLLLLFVEGSSLQRCGLCQIKLIMKAFKKLITEVAKQFFYRPFKSPWNFFPSNKDYVQLQFPSDSKFVN